jgi:hypothetical protein
LNAEKRRELVLDLEDLNDLIIKHLISIHAAWTHFTWRRLIHNDSFFIEFVLKILLVVGCHIGGKVIEKGTYIYFFLIFRFILDTEFIDLYKGQGQNFGDGDPNTTLVRDLLYICTAINPFRVFKLRTEDFSNLH